MNANIISNAATLSIHTSDVRSFEWNGSGYVGPDGLVIWIGWSEGGWGNGPYRYDIKVSEKKPNTETIREARDRRESDVTRAYRPLRPTDVHDGEDFIPAVWNAACRAVTEYFSHLFVEREKKDRRRIEDRLRKDRAFLRAVIELERKLQEDEY